MATEKSWQSRIGEATDAVAQSFVESISYDRRIYKQDVAGSIAHATMLAKVGLVSGGERDAIIEGLKGIERDIEAGTFVFDESLEDIHMAVEAALIERIGEPGRKLHTGRSRNDQVACDLYLWLNGSPAFQIDGCNRLRDAEAGGPRPCVLRACDAEHGHRHAVVHAFAARPADRRGRGGRRLGAGFSGLFLAISGHVQQMEPVGKRRDRGNFAAAGPPGDLRRIRRGDAPV